MTLLDSEQAMSEFQNLTPPELDEAIRLSIEAGLYPAAAGACDLIGQLPNASDLLVSADQSGLIRALQSGDRNVQYAAVQAIAALDPEKGFNGSSYYLESLIMLAGFGEQQAVLVCHPDTVHARNLAVAIQLSGMHGLTASNGRDFFQQAASDANIQILMLHESIGQPDAATLVKQLRTDWRTCRLPIAILSSDPNPRRSERVADRDELVIVLPYTNDAHLVNLQVQRLMNLSAPWMVDVNDGLEQSQWAVDLLVKIAKNREQYAFLNLNEKQERLIGLLNRQRFTDPAIQIIETLGTPDAQRALVNFASQNGYPIEQRTAASMAFGRSIREKGLLLTTAEIQLQYDRYNASENESVDSQRVLGSILDQIEHRSRASDPVASDK
jgi:hypothetical protein